MSSLSLYRYHTVTGDHGVAVKIPTTFPDCVASCEVSAAGRNGFRGGQRRTLRHRTPQLMQGNVITKKLDLSACHPSHAIRHSSQPGITILPTYFSAKMIPFFSCFSPDHCPICQVFRRGLCTGWVDFNAVGTSANGFLLI